MPQVNKNNTLYIKIKFKHWIKSCLTWCTQDVTKYDSDWLDLTLKKIPDPPKKLDPVPILQKKNWPNSTVNKIIIRPDIDFSKFHNFCYRILSITGIEDRLQDNVPETIYDLKRDQTYNIIHENIESGLRFTRSDPRDVKSRTIWDILLHQYKFALKKTKYLRRIRIPVFGAANALATSLSSNSCYGWA